MSETTVFEHGYAVVIGVDDNQIKRLALPTVAKDVQAVYDVLIHPARCAYKEENVKFIRGEDSTRRNILESLYWLQEQVANDPDATAVVYYSGHGMEDKDARQYYLIPYDIQSIGRIRANAIKAEELTAEISAIDAGRLLVILDCCHAAGMDVKDIDLETAARTPNVEASAFPIDLPETKDVPEYTAEPGARKDVSDLLEGEGRAILNSSSGSQSSYIRKDGAMSLFTYHLIEALTGHAPHPDDATVVYVTDVMSWVTHEVKKSAAREGRNQTPVMRTSGVFPVAQLIGGKGLAKGIDAPDPLAPLPEAGVAVQADTIQDTIIAGGDVDQQTGGVRIGEDAQVSGPFVGGDVGGDFVAGDKVAGDQQKTVFNQQGQTVSGEQVNVGRMEGGHIGDIVSGDHIGGDNIIVGDITGASGIGIGQGASGTINYGDTYSGDFRGANLNIKSTLTDVIQTVGAMPNASESAKKELEQLIRQLNLLLQSVPGSQEDAANDVASATQALIETASDDKPNQTVVQGMGTLLKQTAQAFKDNLPQIVDVAGKIAAAAAAVAQVSGG